MNLEEARETIRTVDEKMAELFVARMEAVRDVAAYKRERGLPIEDKEQEARVLQGRGELVEDAEMRSFYLQFLQDTMDVSKRWQHHLMNGTRVAYSGVEGAFAHIAARRLFPDAEHVSYLSFEEAYESVVSGECDVVVLPIENSQAGEVGQVLDLIQMLAGSGLDAKIIAASFKNVYQVHQLITAGIQAVTVAPDVVWNMVKHPSTQIAVDEFVDAWDAAFGRRTFA